MRLPQLVFFLICLSTVPLFLFSLSVFFSYFYSTFDSAQPVNAGEKSGFRALFSFPTPSAWFPPSAIIGLTDDNSSFFLARPAAFGPPLPNSGISGKLWIGSGFGDDNARRESGLGTSAEGELGCSDAPDWESGHHGRLDALASESVEYSRETVKGDVRGGSVTSEDELRDKQAERANRDRHTSTSASHERTSSPYDDGTDDYLYRPLPGHKSSRSQHADIQSLQESAEIAGKVVLLSRGGCGFLEKVMWVQRRGGLAMIVGDDRRGGSLVTMYARGDTSNVSIPSLFTSYTTAHLLSSLVPPEGLSSEPALSDSTKSSTKDSGPRSSARREHKKKDRVGNDQPTFTPVVAKPRATSTGRAGNVASAARRLDFASAHHDPHVHSHFGWIRKLFSFFGLKDSKTSFPGVEADSRRPPSSGQLDWVLVDDVTGKNNAPTGNPSLAPSAKSVSGLKTADANSGGAADRSTGNESQGDDFIIGVQDWRDKDLLGPKSLKQSTPSSEQQSHDSKSPSQRSQDRKSSVPLANDHATSGAGSTGPADKKKDDESFEGGVITPGSGEYSDPAKKGNSGSSMHANDAGDSIAGARASPMGDASSKGYENRDKSGDTRMQGWTSNQDDSATSDGDDEVEHDGLWVTLTPTTMSTNPFFDTLLVLVVSPLVTLTVVYGLLLVRSRIRRRRWRAPRSVVDKLPVRTYHTLSTSSSTNLTTLRYSTPSSNSPTCPLLYSEPLLAAPQRSRQRPAAGIFGDSSVARSWPPGAHEAPIMPEAEKVVATAGNRGRRYFGKQIECVICLEEYVDGVSRVMSLPCGHEFHAECITPWLTTRRRTCPICKGDVVRSLANRSFDCDTSYRDDPQEDNEQALGIGGFMERSPFIGPDSEEENTDVERADLGTPFAQADSQGVPAR